MRRMLPHAALAAALVVGAAGCAGTAASTSASGPTPAGEVDTRPKLLVPALTVQGGADEDAGKKVAERLRKLVSGMATYGAIPTDSLEHSMMRYSLTSLDSITARQLAQQIGAMLVLIGSVQPAASGLQAHARVVDVRTGDRFPLEPVTGANTNAVAQQLFSEFQTRAVGFAQVMRCGEAVVAEQYPQALAVCDSALAIVPASSTALYGKAVALANTDAYEQALAAYQKVLELDPMNDRALQGAGLAASKLGRADLAKEFYEKYIDLTGGDVATRLRIAAEVATAGDYLTAYDLVQPVIAEKRGDPEFENFLLAVSTAAGSAVQNESGEEAARPYYQTALDAFNAVYADTVQKDLTAYRQGIAINSALGNTSQALELARMATAQFDTSSVAWSQYAAALDAAENYPEEIQALTRLIQVAPDFENAYLRRGLAYLNAGQQDEALADLQQAAGRGNTENVAKVLYSTGAQALQAQDYARAAELLAPAFQYAPASLKSDIGYYLGFALVQQGTADAKANRNSAALKEFQQAIAALQASQNENAAQLLQYAQQYAAALSQ